MSYAIHCTVKMYGEKLETSMISSPIYYLDAKDEVTAIESAKDKIYTDYSDPLVNITGIEIDLVRKVGV